MKQISNSSVGYSLGGSPQAKLDVLACLVESEFTISGLARVLTQWLLESVSIHDCEITLFRQRGTHRIFKGQWDGPTIVVRERILSEEGQQPTNESETEYLLPETTPEVKEPEGITDAAAIRMPIEHGLRAIGSLTVVPSATSALKIEEMETLSRLCKYFGFLFAHRTAMEQAAEWAIHDELTGLYNRRYLRQSLDYWLNKAKTDRFPVSVILMDVDHFKKFNDTFGHLTGDRILVHLGQLMKSVFRSQDIVCRYGGEEFAVLLCDRRSEQPADHPREVFQFAERFRSAAESLRLPLEDGRSLLHITISGGIATYPWDAASAEELIGRADEALYHAKRSGRNQIRLAHWEEASKAS